MSRLTDAELDEVLAYAQMIHGLRLTAAVAELKERRAADLTNEQRGALWFAREIVWTCGIPSYETNAALAALDKLLGKDG